MLFPDTCWTMLAQATLRGGPEERAALERLCRDYWHPVCACIRARGAPPDRVEDLTQDFFLHLMTKGVFRRADQAQGKFRTYLLGALRYFLADDAEHHKTQRLGGHLRRTALTDDIPDPAAEEAVFDREWAQALLSRALQSVETESVASRGAEVWDVLRTFLPGASVPAGYERLAQVMKIGEGGAKAEVSRLRSRYREALRREVARTVGEPEEVESELQHLRAVLTAGLA